MRSHDSWPVCPTCGGTGEENERGHYVERTFAGERHGTPYTESLRVWEALPDPRPGAYAGGCRACDALGRVQPAGWREALFDVDGTLLHAGTNPDLVPIAKAKGLPYGS